jgi:hypothetical protein
MPLENEDLQTLYTKKKNSAAPALEHSEILRLATLHQS